MWFFNKSGKVKENEKKQGKIKGNSNNRRYTIAEKVSILKEYEKRGQSVNRFCHWYGVSNDSLAQWQKKYNELGEAGLASKNGGLPKTEVAESVKAEIIRLKKENPVMGGRQISDWLLRNKFVTVTYLTVLKVLKTNSETAALVKEYHHRPGRTHPKVHRFERSNARDMYQMDIMVWMLKGLFRVYMIICLDDYSRFVVSFGIFRRARSSEVVDVLRAAIELYGQPKEVLTDNGPQFYAWRGKSEFKRFLVKSGIQGVRSRPRHPQTLGKVESFWRNLNQELLSRIPISSFEEMQQKVEAWVKYYNYQRPHQGINGLVPADRFFGIEKPIHEAMEKGAAMVKDALVVDPKRLKEPMYLVGRVDGREIRLMAKEGSIIVSGLDEVEKKDSPEAITGVKLESKEPNPEAAHDNRGTDGSSTGNITGEQVQSPVTGPVESQNSAGPVAEENNVTECTAGIQNNQGDTITVETEMPGRDDSGSGIREIRPQA